MKKQSGFTLIELMVVMAIIAILAIAGLAAYVGYIKQARDTARISDLSVINKALLAELTNKGKSPNDIDDVVAAIRSVTGWSLPEDPTGISTCLSAAGAASDKLCAYVYRQCDSGGGFAVSTRFESKNNAVKYTADGIDGVDNFEWTTKSNVDSYWSLGACTSVTCSWTGDCVIDDHEPITPTVAP